MEERTFGWRQLLGAVNLSDFAKMVGAELGQIATSIRLAAESLPKLPFGPLVFIAAILMVLFRSVLLVLVVVFFGAAILLLGAIWSIRRGRRPG